MFKTRLWIFRTACVVPVALLSATAAACPPADADKATDARASGPDVKKDVQRLNLGALVGPNDTARDDKAHVVTRVRINDGNRTRVLDLRSVLGVELREMVRELVQKDGNHFGELAVVLDELKVRGQRDHDGPHHGEHGRADNDKHHDQPHPPKPSKGPDGREMHHPPHPGPGPHMDRPDRAPRFPGRQQMREEIERRLNEFRERMRDHDGPPGPRGDVRPPHPPEPPHPPRPDDRPGPEELQRRLEHIHVAIEHLHQAGLHEPAERLQQRAAEWERAIDEHHRRQRDHHEDADRNLRLHNALQDLHHQVAELRDMVMHLQNQMREMHEHRDRR